MPTTRSQAKLAAAVRDELSETKAPDTTTTKATYSRSTTSKAKKTRLESAPTAAAKPSAKKPASSAKSKKTPAPANQKDDIPALENLSLADSPTTSHILRLPPELKSALFTSCARHSLSTALSLAKTCTAFYAAYRAVEARILEIEFRRRTIDNSKFIPALILGEIYTSLGSDSGGYDPESFTPVPANKMFELAGKTGRFRDSGNTPATANAKSGKQGQKTSKPKETLSALQLRNALRTHRRAVSFARFLSKTQYETYHGISYESNPEDDEGDLPQWLECAYAKFFRWAIQNGEEEGAQNEEVCRVRDKLLKPPRVAVINRRNEPILEEMEHFEDLFGLVSLEFPNDVVMDAVEKHAEAVRDLVDELQLGMYKAQRLREMVGEREAEWVVDGVIEALVRPEGREGESREPNWGFSVSVAVEERGSKGEKEALLRWLRWRWNENKLMTVELVRPETEAEILNGL